MVVRLYPVGERNEFLWYEFDSVESLLSAIRETQRNDIGNSVMAYNSSGLYSIVADHRDRMDAEVRGRIKSMIPESAWYLFIELEGAAERVEAEVRITDRICLERNGGKLVRFPDEKMMKYLRDYTSHRGEAVMHQCNGGFWGFWCTLQSSKIIPFMREVNPMLDNLGLRDPVYPDEPMSVRWVIILFDRGTTMVCGISVEYDQLDRVQVEKLSEMVQPLIITMLKYGGTIPLTMKALTDMLLMPSYANLIRGIKKLIDPENILAPNRLC